MPRYTRCNEHGEHPNWAIWPVKLTNFMLSFCFAFSYLKFYFEILLSKLDRQQQFESTFAAIIEIFFYIGFGSTNIFALKLHDTQHYPDRCAH